MQLEHLPIEGEVVVHHPVDVEAPFYRGAHSCPVKRPRRIDGCGGLVERIDEETVHVVTHDLAHRAALSSNHRRATGHRLDDAEAERLVEVDEMQQHPGAAE